MTELELKNRFWVMKKLPDGNDFESALEIKEENKIIIPEGCFATKNKYLSCLLYTSPSPRDNR